MTQALAASGKRVIEKNMLEFSNVGANEQTAWCILHLALAKNSFRARFELNITRKKFICKTLHLAHWNSFNRYKWECALLPLTLLHSYELNSPL